MKNPNGYGTIKKLSGARRRPFVFMISVNGKQKAMGYFATNENMNLAVVAIGV